MALIVCPECGREFSDMSQFCPACGLPKDVALQRQGEISQQQYSPTSQPNNYQQPQMVAPQPSLYYQPNYSSGKSKASIWIIAIIAFTVVALAALAVFAFDPFGWKSEENVNTLSKVEEVSQPSTSTPMRDPKWVIINGSGVRLRFQPSMDAGYLEYYDYNKQKFRVRSVPKGTRLPYDNYDDGVWYRVKYEGESFYVNHAATNKSGESLCYLEY